MPKRRQRGEGGLFRRASDGRWVGSIELGWVDGKRKRRRVYGKTMAEAQAKMRKAKAEVAAGNYRTHGTTLERWLDAWLTEVAPGKQKMRPKTLHNYESYARNYLVPALGHVRLDAIAAHHIRELHRFILGKGLSATTAGHAHSILSTALNDAIREGLITANPAELVDHPRGGGNVRRALTVEEVRRLLEVVEGKPNATRWLVALMLGLRQGECLGLRWGRVDLVYGSITVDTQLQRIPYKAGSTGELRTLPGYNYTVVKGNLCLVTTKTESSRRIVPIPEMLRHALIDHWYNLPTGAPRPDDLVWTALGHPIEPTADRRDWHFLLRQAAIPDTDLHSARHTAATLLLALGIGEDIRMEILGHSTATARRIYSHVDLEVSRRAVAALESAITDKTVQDSTGTDGGEIDA